MKTIVALLDFSDVTAKVLKELQKLAQAFKSHVIVLHGIPMKPAVVEVGVMSPTIFEEPSEEAIQGDLARLQKLTSPLKRRGVNVTLKQLYDTDVEHLVKEALQLEADLIVVGSHQHNPFYNLLVDSVTNSVLRCASCPVLVVPADE